MKLSQLGELALLEHLKKRFEKTSKKILVGIGDDTAVIRPIQKNLLVTTDMMVEGVHFDRMFITPYQLGFKLISINVSDIYAMGGIPHYILLNLAVSKKTDTDVIEQFLDGVIDAQRRYNTITIGGDLSAIHDGMVLAATILGYTDRHIGRSGATVGDKVYITGCLGDSACGLELLKRFKKPVPLETISKEQRAKSREPRNKRSDSISSARRLLLQKGLSWDIVEPLLRRHLIPEARNPKKFRVATSMIDVSDGLLLDLSRICDESKVGALIYKEKIPVSSELKQVASCLGLSPPQLALSGGEDYELLFTAPPQKRVRAIHIGEIIKRGRFIIDRSGGKKPFPPKGYQHFS
jgi:thiamine-monophosphate kinase